MDFYIDIKLKADPEMPINRLLNTLYTKLHKVLSELNSQTIGVSFPEYQVLLGKVMRIHGTKTDLVELQNKNWIGAVSGYCQVSDISTVPSDCQYRTVGRIQPLMSESKLKRLIKRGSITETEVKEYKAKMFTKGLDQPYLELVSVSNGQKHRRYINFGEIIDSPQQGEFDQFGLSKSATVPWF